MFIRSLYFTSKIKPACFTYFVIFGFLILINYLQMQTFIFGILCRFEKVADDEINSDKFFIYVNYVVILNFIKHKIIDFKYHLFISFIIAMSSCFCNYIYWILYTVCVKIVYCFLIKLLMSYILL